MIDFRRADLHTHTHHSDGQLAPAKLVAKARQHGLYALAITDHDGIDGLEEASEAGRTCGVEVIAGVELSVTVGQEEVHLLGYCFDPQHEGLRRHLRRFRSARHRRGEQMVERLHALGVPLAFASVLEEARDGVLGRPHVAAALVREGHVASYLEAFERYLKDGGPAWVAKPLFPAEEALALLHDAGGLGVLAHPGHWTSDAVLMALIRAGLDGIETVHPAHDEMLKRYYRQTARDFGLIETGGSDYHGQRPQDEANLGRYAIPYPQLDRVKRRGEEEKARV